MYFSSFWYAEMLNIFIANETLTNKNQILLYIIVAFSKKAKVPSLK